MFCTQIKSQSPKLLWLRLRLLTEDGKVTGYWSVMPVL